MKYLYILRQPPYQGALAREALDMVLATAAFDQQVSLLFINDGVFQLCTNQNSKTLQQKNIEKTLQAFALYNISEIYYCQDSMDQRGLSVQDIYAAAKPLASKQHQTLLTSVDKVISL